MTNFCNLLMSLIKNLNRFRNVKKKEDFEKLKYFDNVRQSESRGCTFCKRLFITSKFRYLQLLFEDLLGLSHLNRSFSFKDYFSIR